MKNIIKHVMLVDDDEDDRMIFNIVVSDIAPSITVTTAEDGDTALKSLLKPNASLPDLILLDINMPVMNGLECLKELKKNNILKEIPVMMYSTSCNEKEVKRARSLGACHYIVKPFSIDEYKLLFENVFSLDLKKLVSPAPEENYIMDTKSMPLSN